MPTILNLPPLEKGATEATIERYFHAEGAHVELGQPLAVVVTDRFEWEVPATSAGTIKEIVAQPGMVVAIGAPILQIEPNATTVTTSESPQRVVSNEQRATPLARRIAATHGLSLAAVTGSGRGGRITRSDVLGVLQLEAEIAVPPRNGRVSVENSIAETSASPTTAIDDQQVLEVASITAAQTKHSIADAPRSIQQYQPLVQNVPLALTAVDVDMTAVQRYVAANAARSAKRGIRLDANICVMYITANALGRHRLLNSAWHDDGIIIRQRINLGWLNTETPLTIPNAADLSIQGLARRLSGHFASEPTVPTFGISTGTAGFWSEQPTMGGYSAALHIGASTRRPYVVEEHGGDTIKLRSIAILTLTYDARIAEQHQVDAFLIDIKQRLEHFDALC